MARVVDNLSSMKTRGWPSTGTSSIYAVAPSGLARAHAMTGNVAASLEAYERFLSGWADADSDIPVLLEARREYHRLKSGATPPAEP